MSDWHVLSLFINFFLLYGFLDARYWGNAFKESHIKELEWRTKNNDYWFKLGVDSVSKEPDNGNISDK